MSSLVRVISSLVPSLAMALLAPMALMAATPLGAQVRTLDRSGLKLVAPVPPDYSALSSWAAHPDVSDEADRVPKGEVDLQDVVFADIFFVHPTTYLSLRSRNADTAKGSLNRFTDRTTIRSQASVFNGAGRVYAPRYRQASLGAVTQVDETSLAVRELAFSDVLRAFDYFLETWNAGRPIVIAGHSQGAQHALRLLEERFAGRSLRRRLVAAYLAGQPVPRDKFKRTLQGLYRCRNEFDQRCVASWNTIAPDADRERFGEVTLHYPEGWEANTGKKLLCTNPLSFAKGPADANGPRNGVRARGRVLERRPGPTQAGCKKGLLVIDPPDQSDFDSRDGDYHRYDFGLFYMDLREAVLRRVDAGS